MNIYAILTFVFGIVAVVIGIVYIVFSSLLLKLNTEATKSTLLNSFPSELMSTPKLSNRKIYFSLSIISSLLSLAFYGLTFSGMIPANIPNLSSIIVPIFLIFISILETIFMLLSQIISIDKTKLFLASTIAFICLLSGIGIFPLVVVNSSIGLLKHNLIICYIVMALGMISLISLANPKLKSGFYLEKTEVNGVTYWIKPKFNWFCFTIWFNYIMNYTIILLLSISSLLSAFN